MSDIFWNTKIWELGVLQPSSFHDHGLDDRGFDSRWGLEIFLFHTVPRPALEPTQPPIQWVPRTLSFGEYSGRGVNLTTHLHLVPKSKNVWGYTSTPPIRLHGVMLS